MTETLTLSRKSTFVVEQCYACGVDFAVLEQWHKDRLSDKGNFYCPNGHPQHFVGKSDAELRHEAEQRARRAEARAQAERDQRLAAERELGRQRQRAKAGACPCCKRTFVQLARHMKAKHPGYEP